MLFKWELIEKIVRGEKIQTRRPVKEGEEFWRNHLGKPSCITHNGRKKIVIGKDYAVQYGRGKPTVQYQKYRGESRMFRDVMSYDFYKNLADKQGDDAHGFLLHYGYKPLRILITDIRRQDVRNISLEDAEAEGFCSQAEFLLTWCGFYDKRIGGLCQTDGVVLWVDGAGVPYASDVVDFGKWLHTNRPDKLYQAWAYTFEVV